MNLGKTPGGGCGAVKFVVTLFAFFVVSIVDAAPAPQAQHSDTSAKPILARINPVSLFEIDLTWRDKSQNEDGFQIERSIDKIHFQQIAQVLPGTTIYRDKNLFPGTRYYYRIRAHNASGSSAYSTGSASTSMPPRPLTIVEWGYTNSAPPIASNFVSVSAGGFHGLALKKDGSVVGWGDNTWGQSVPPTNLNGVVAISAGSIHSLALKNDGTVVGWGYNNDGEATPPPNLTGVVAVAAGYHHSLALKGDGTVVGWGNNAFGETTPPSDLNGVVAIAAGFNHSLALKSDGTVVQWGDTNTAFLPPANLTSVTAIAAGDSLSFALKSDGTVAAWGGTALGLIQAISNATDLADIAIAGYQGVGLKNDGALVLLGNQTNYYQFSLIPPDLGTGATMLSARDYHGMTLSTSPTPPSDLSCTVLATNKIRLTWHANSADEKNFLIERSEQSTEILGSSASPWTQIVRVGRNATNYTDNTVSPGIMYWYRVRAQSPFGTSLYSQRVPVITTPLSTPFASIALGTNEVDLSWWDSYADLYESIPFGGIDGFKIERAPDNNGKPGSWTEIASVISSQYSFADSTVAANTIYWYRVRAFNSVGLSDYSAPVSVNVLPPPTPESFIADVQIDHVTLFWFSPSPWTPEVKIERAPDVGGSPGSWTEITNVEPNIDTYVDQGLPLNTTWWYRLQAFNWIGDSPYTDPISVTILPPATPYFGAVSIGPTDNVQLLWYQNIVEPDGFQLERAPDVNGQPGNWAQIFTSNPYDPNGNTFSDTNIVINNTYWYRVRAYNVLGESDYSVPVSISVVPPEAPASLTASQFKDQVNLSWDYVASDTFGFKIERAPDVSGSPGDWTQIGLTHGNIHSFTDTSRAPGLTYWYRIRAFDWIGDSPYTDPISVTILPPNTPSDLTALVAPDTNQVILIWYSSQDADGFYVEFAPDTNGAPGTWTLLATTPAETPPYGANFYTDTNAQPYTTNWYRVRAFSAAGISDYSAPANIAIIPPGKPNASAYPLANKAELDWSTGNEQEDQTVSWIIQRASDVNGAPGTWTQIAALEKGNFYYTDPSGAAGATAWYRVQAITWVGGSPFSDPVSVTFAPPAVPSSPNFELGTTNVLYLQWTDAGDEDGFKIERAPDTDGLPGQWIEIGTSLSPYTVNGGFVDTNVIANTTNWYRIRAFAGNDFSAYSDPVPMGIVPPQAPYIYFPTTSPGQIDLSWYSSDYYFANVAGFELQRAPDSNGSPGTWQTITNTTTSPYVDFDVISGATYWYRLRSYNWVGESPYTSVNVTAYLVNPIPTAFLSLTPINGSMLIEWSTTGGNVDTVQAAASPTGSYSDISPPLLIGGTGPTTTNYLDAGALTNTPTRFYRIQSTH